LVKRLAHVLALVGLALASVGQSSTVVAFADTAAQVAQSAPQVQRTGPGFQEHHELRGNEEDVDVDVCSTAIAQSQAHCDARVRTDAKATTLRPARAGQPQPAASIGNSGAYDPGYLQSAYNVASVVSAGAGKGQTVAIVDAYDDPNAHSDLDYYRGWFGLPPLPACSAWPSASACLRKVNQFGAAGSYPGTDSGWALEIALDLEMVSSICPNCSILLVEANSNTYSDLSAAVSEAVTLGADVVSNSYGGGEWSGESGFDAAYNHPGVAITVSSGDAGYGTEYPAASQYVIAVGGTSLTQATNTGTRNGTETAWSGAGSGCSAYESKPSWQQDRGCGSRTVADVSAVADPGTGVWVYDTFGESGWLIVGGTSVAAPIVGSVYALAGNRLGTTSSLSSDPYNAVATAMANHSALPLFDVTSGSNGACGMYLCTAVSGYDGPTGLGTPNGVAAFTNAIADFSLKAGSTTLRARSGGPSVTDTLTLSAVNNYDANVQLSISGVPTGVTASFSTTTITPTATSLLTVKAPPTAVGGTYMLTITANGSDGTVHTRLLQLTVR
jgi:subtilase family serine protease